MPESLVIDTVISSEDFYLAAGTVTVDPIARKVLILLDTQNITYQLPRGRKDIGESLAATAVRETFEETGYRPKLLAVPLTTRATIPSAGVTEASHPDYTALQSAKRDENGNVVQGALRLSEEPFAVMQHHQNVGALSIVLWFIGIADSNGPREMGTQMADEEYEPVWAGYEEALELLTDKAYAKVMASGLRLVEQVVQEEGAKAAMACLIPKEEIKVEQHAGEMVR